jgi:hypothetical protein
MQNAEGSCSGEQSCVVIRTELVRQVFSSAVHDNHTGRSCRSREPIGMPGEISALRCGGQFSQRSPLAEHPLLEFLQDYCCVGWRNQFD